MRHDRNRDRTIMKRNSTMLAKSALLAIGIAAKCAIAANAAAPKPETFADPQKAADALVAAARDNDPAELLKIFGPAGKDLVTSGDPVADKDAHMRFVERYGKAEKITFNAAGNAMLVIGTEEWPFPIPLVKHGGVWHFDAAAGLQEILNRRIGRDELSTMEVCRVYVQAQREYAAGLTSEKKTAEYAQKIVSSPDLRDGLYWPVKDGEPQSPLGPQMAKARAEGYDSTSQNVEREPYHGYFYKILTRQGAMAPGGARDYVIDGHMTGGFALIAFPAKYGDSGVMTFIVNQAGIVFQKNLGPNTATIAAGISEFNPDMTWKMR
jgi:Protein of unknown function (DUF2950)